MQILPSFTKLINYLQSSTSFSRLPPNIHVAKTTLVMTTTCGMIESYQKKHTHIHSDGRDGPLKSTKHTAPKTIRKNFTI